MFFHHKMHSSRDKSDKEDVETCKQNIKTPEKMPQVANRKLGTTRVGHQRKKLWSYMPENDIR